MSVSEAEIETFYQANLNQFQTPEEVDIALVAFVKPGSADSVELFSNLVYEQSDTLEPAAKKLNLPIQSIQGLRRQGLPAERVGKLAPELQRVVTNPKFLQAVFSADTLVNKRNTEAVEIAPGVLASARVSAHRPAGSSCAVIRLLRRPHRRLKRRSMRLRKFPQRNWRLSRGFPPPRS